MSQNPTRVLLVDDDPDLGVSTQALLKPDGIELAVARSVEEATARLASEPVDLILLDIGLPTPEQGFGLLNAIRANPTHADTPVVMLTAWSRSEDKVRALDQGATDYLTKPFDGAELRARVRCALRTKSLQSELAQLNVDLQSARDQAQGEAKAKAGLLAFKSHEIRSFMNGILPNAGFLAGTHLTDEQRDYVETIRQSSENILTIVNDILDFSRIESGKLELEAQPFDLRQCVEDTLDTLAPKAGEKRLDLSYLMADGVPVRVIGDVTRLRQILVNLIGNAVKFTSKGEVAVDVLSTGVDRVQFSVRDTGIGIPQDKQGRLFNPFCQADAATSREYGGTGLGLSISRRLVDLMGGRMWLESEFGQGTTLHFELPLRAAADGLGTTRSIARSRLAGLRLLTIDDNPRIQQVLTAIAGRWGADVQAAGSVEEALRYLDGGEPFDLILVDSTLGEADPTAVATKLRLARSSAQARLVLVSAVGSRLSSNLFAAQITKPLKPAHVRDTVLRLITGTRETAPSSKPVVTKQKLADLHPMTVLLCDDNVVNQKVASRMLGQLGYTPDLAGNGVEALQAFEAKHYDMVFLDVQMPEMDGLEAAAKLRERQRNPQEHPHCQPPPIIIAMTASAMPGDRDRCLKAGMDDYLSKPVRPDDLRKMIESWGPRLISGQSTPAEDAPEAQDQAQDEGILDWDRLIELADHDQDMLKELLELYLTETDKQMQELGAAVASSSAPDVKRLAHKCAGGSATIGVGRLVPILRELEQLGDEGRLEPTASLYQQAETEFQILRRHILRHPEGVLATKTS